MKKYIPISLLILLITSNISLSAQKIQTKNAPFHQGEEVVACGELKEVTNFRKGVYLNMDKPYPKQTMTFIIWESDIDEFKKKHGDLRMLVNTNICGMGLVSEYKNNIQIKLHKPYSLQVNE